jgi:hypothetical protein
MSEGLGLDIMVVPSAPILWSSCDDPISEAFMMWGMSAIAPELPTLGGVSRGRL